MKNFRWLAFLLLSAGAAHAQDPGGDPGRREALSKLEMLRVSVDFSRTPLSDAVDYLRDFSGLNFVLDKDVVSRTDLQVTLRVKDLTLKSVLKLMLEGNGLTATWRDGVLLILPREKLQKVVTTQVYDIADLMHQPQDAPGPLVELSAPGGGAALAGAAFTLDESGSESAITPDFIIDLIRQSTGGRSWDENPDASITQVQGVLIVTQSVRTHAEIRRLLQLLRQYK